MIFSPLLWGKAVAVADGNALADPQQSLLAAGRTLAGISPAGVRPATVKISTLPKPAPLPVPFNPGPLMVDPAAINPGQFTLRAPVAPPAAVAAVVAPVDSCGSCVAAAAGIAASTADETMLSGAVQQSEQVAAPVSTMPKWAPWLLLAIAFVAIASGGRK